MITNPIRRWSRPWQSSFGTGYATGPMQRLLDLIANRAGSDRSTGTIDPERGHDTADDHAVDAPVDSIHDIDPASVAEGSDEPTTTARELATAIGAVELDLLHLHHDQLVVAVADLVRASGRSWPLERDDPTVAVLRALAKVAIDAPDASSAHAAALHRALQGSS